MNARSNRIPLFQLLKWRSVRCQRAHRPTRTGHELAVLPRASTSLAASALRQPLLLVGLKQRDPSFYQLRLLAASSDQTPDEKRRVTDEQARIFTIPNCLTTARILVTPYINYLVVVGQHETACVLFALAGFTDFLDGYIARRWPKTQMSPLGSIIDPFADKFLIGTLTVSLCASGLLPLELACLILARDIGLIGASLFVYVRNYRTLAAPRDPSTAPPAGLLASLKTSVSKIKVEADWISKFNTFLQLTLITVTLPSALFAYNDSIYLALLQYATGTTTVLSGLSYLYKRGSYQIK